MEKISGMGKETSEISDHIKLHIENGKILSLKTHRVSKSVEEHIKEAVGLILDRLTYPTLVPTLYTIIKELAINACKANQKRVFFEERGYSMLNPSDTPGGERIPRNVFRRDVQRIWNEGQKERILLLN